MKKFDYFKEAVKAQCYRYKGWVIAAFSVIQESPDGYKKDPYPYRLVQTPSGFFFVNPIKENSLEKIEDAKPNIPLFSFKDAVLADNSLCKNIGAPIVATLGNILFNAICLSDVFDVRIPFQTGRVSIGQLENIIASRLKDTPPPGAERSPDAFYVDELLEFNKRISYVENFAQLCVHAATPKNIIAPPGIKEYKQKLIQEYGDRLKDPVVLAEFEGKLKAYDAEWLKDDPSYGILVSGKIANMSRKGMFLSVGAGHGFKESNKVTPVLNSLEEGWPTDPEQFTAMINVSRAGSFFRGKDTEKGGVSAKAFLRAVSNFVIKDEDCGTQLGIHRSYTAKNINKLVGRYIYNGKEWILIENKADADPYVDKTVIVRTPLYCKLEKDTLCRYCVGENLYRNPVGLTSAVTETSSVILATSLAQFHGSVLATQKYNYQEALT